MASQITFNVDQETLGDPTYSIICDNATEYFQLIRLLENEWWPEGKPRTWDPAEQPSIRYSTLQKYAVPSMAVRDALKGTYRIVSYNTFLSMLDLPQVAETVSRDAVKGETFLWRDIEIEQPPYLPDQQRSKKILIAYLLPFSNEPGKVRYGTGYYTHYSFSDDKYFSVPDAAEFNVMPIAWTYIEAVDCLSDTTIDYRLDKYINDYKTVHGEYRPMWNHDNQNQL